jgi:hypothetical protein
MFLITSFSTINPSRIACARAPRQPRRRQYAQAPAQEKNSLNGAVPAMPGAARVLCGTEIC